MLRKTSKPVTSFVGKSMSCVIILGLSIMVYSVITLSSSLDDAQLINHSGSMRTQTYRLAMDIVQNSGKTQQHMREFERILYSPAMRKLDSWTIPNDIRNDYHRLIIQWKSVKGMLQGHERAQFLDNVEPFVQQLDRFVLQLQNYNEMKLKRLAWVGFICLVGILLISLWVVRYMGKNVVAPLGQLLKASEDIKFGSFNIKLNTDLPNELGILAKTFNSMASELGKLYRGLELAVDEKTRRLRQANQSLQVLYQSSQELSASRIKIDNFQAMLHHFTTLEGVISAELEVVDTGGNSLTLHDGLTCQKFPHEQELTVDGEIIGYLRWKEGLPCPERSFINSFSRIFGRAIYYNRAQKQADQLLLLEERATIARELHDSLAQSLSYLKIQMTLLKRIMSQVEDQEIQDKTSAVMSELDTGLSSAYKQLRELLTTFRLTLKESNFGEALKEMVEQLDSQTDAEIVLINQLSSLDIDAHRQVHMIQLLREATINAMKHSRSDKIVIYCGEQDGTVLAYVEDDGIGFSEPASRINHYGMNIMYERAQRLGGQLQIDSQPNEGCKVTLTYQLEKEKNLDHV